MATNLWSKLAKLDYSLLFVALAFRNGLLYRHSDLQSINQSTVYLYGSSKAGLKHAYN